MIQSNKVQTFSTASIGGLTIGLLVAIMIGFWAYDEVDWSYKHFDQIIEVNGADNNRSEAKSARTNEWSLTVPKALGEKYAHLDSAIKLAQRVQSRVIDMFSLKILAVRREIFDDPRAFDAQVSIIQSPPCNRTLINHVIKLNRSMEIKVTGVSLTLFLFSDAHMDEKALTSRHL